MTTMTSSLPATSAAGRIFALATTELRLVVRNRTVAVSAIVVPLGLGLFWALTFNADDIRSYAVVVALQLAFVLAMGTYVTATQTLVARRQSRVLKRMRTTAVSDAGLLVATVAPSVVLAVVQLVLLVGIDAVTGMPAPAGPVWLAVATFGGLVLAVTGALATAVATPSPERAQITTLPLTFLMAGSAIATVVLPADGWWQALVVVPGAAIGALVRTAMAAELVGAVLFPLVSFAGWSLLFAWFAMRRFRWDPRL